MRWVPATPQFPQRIISVRRSSVSRSLAVVLLRINTLDFVTEGLAAVCDVGIG